MKEVLFFVTTSWRPRTDWAAWTAWTGLDGLSGRRVTRWKDKDCWAFHRQPLFIPPKAGLTCLLCNAALGAGLVEGDATVQDSNSPRTVPLCNEGQVH